NEWSPLGAAARDSPGTARVLLAHGARANEPGNNSGDRPLAIAAYWGRPDVVRLLLTSGAKVDLPNNRGDTALMKAVEYERPNHGATVQILLDAGANLEAVNRNGLTPLAVAVEHGNAPAIKTLLGHGARMDVKTNDGLTLAQLADKGAKFRG